MCRRQWPIFRGLSVEARSRLVHNATSTLGDIVVKSNLYHNNTAVRQIIEAAGAKLRDLRSA
jgi:hypothetical protein